MINAAQSPCWTGVAKRGGAEVDGRMFWVRARDQLDWEWGATIETVFKATITGSIGLRVRRMDAGCRRRRAGRVMRVQINIDDRAAIVSSVLKLARRCVAIVQVPCNILTICLFTPKSRRRGKHLQRCARPERRKH